MAAVSFTIINGAVCNLSDLFFLSYTNKRYDLTQIENSLGDTIIITH